MMKKFKIPTGICEEAEQYMRDLVMNMENKFMVIDGFDYEGLTRLAWAYHNWWKSIETPESNLNYADQIRELWIEFRLTPRSRYGDSMGIKRELFDSKEDLKIR